jgi:hypothetical protein
LRANVVKRQISKAAVLDRIAEEKEKEEEEVK